MAAPRDQLVIAPVITAALAAGRPVVALETAVLTHGLPRPHNIETALAMEDAARAAGATPATIGVLDGRLVVGLARREIERLGAETTAAKASVRDLPVAMAHGWSAGTTVAATAFIAAAAGISVFATGGIGGVHRGAGQSLDISADLPTLAQTPITVVCAGAKSILDLAATLEWLETAAVPVVGYGTDSLPGFFVRDTGLPLPARADSPAQVAAIVRAQRALGMSQGLIVAVPPPAEAALAAAETEPALDQALARQDELGIHGREVTPFLLRELAERSGGATLRANVALLLNNVRVAAAIAHALAATASG